MTLNEGLRRRLEALNRGPLPVAVAEAPSGPPGPAAPGVAGAGPAARALRPGVVRPIPGLLRRGGATTNEWGEHWRICLPLDEIWPGGEALSRKRHEHLTTACTGGEARGLGPVVEAFPGRLLLLDLETCGLAGSALFLVGLLRRIDGCLAVELLLARDYSEERAVLASLWQRLKGDEVVVTFNGKSFDWPMVVDRSRRHLLLRGAGPPAPLHIDLLHATRRRWRGTLPDCRLKTLERHICGRMRSEDIASHLIPAAYQQYVRTGFEREMDAILLHNAIDLTTMLDLAMRLAG
ncbi:MAG: ribonuclease H-like domain-containing protein [Pirellulales bacterium]|nr:ribonuclease H-like domain-containing protein [Pirellulales bacterium]